MRAYAVSGATSGLSSYHTGGDTFEVLTVTITIPTNATNITLAVKFDASTTAYLDNATAVIGSTAQTYYPLHPADEWERAQRYYEVHGGLAGAPGWPIFTAYTPSTDQPRFVVTFAVRKAVVPTVTVNGTWTGPALTIESPNEAGYAARFTGTAATFNQTYTNSADDTITAEANP
ncbi:hypothetical protein A2797_02455 [candidate division WWE3 bacterium RIFCSPHIGHO2_01_FULL_48_15]|uniref:Uncharacterized protein n=1 Tax=candidate division WWE3 bacterium RIFCSPHIGHO2_01_FULL_48_15 TaxID=1802619 RepID=A0A1F4VCU8_UNCKA|nr:MAG: hypothetical protein A2797_02455 [candidate division WWE3 bacterium RIFCSPHIGHO2_01_FULL_48_15]